MMFNFSWSSLPQPAITATTNVRYHTHTHAYTHICTVACAVYSSVCSPCSFELFMNSTSTLTQTHATTRTHTYIHTYKHNCKCALLPFGKGHLLYWLDTFFVCWLACLVCASTAYALLLFATLKSWIARQLRSPHGQPPLALLALKAL